MQLSEGLKTVLLSELYIKYIDPGMMNRNQNDIFLEFRSLQYALFLTMFVAVFGSLFFFITALYIQKDKALVDLVIAGK